jgi:hypothetical protein
MPGGQTDCSSCREHSNRKPNRESGGRRVMVTLIHSGNRVRCVHRVQTRNTAGCIGRMDAVDDAFPDTLLRPSWQVADPSSRTDQIDENLDRASWAFACVPARRTCVSGFGPFAVRLISSIRLLGTDSGSMGRTRAEAISYGQICVTAIARPIRRLRRRLPTCRVGFK